jgi:hypothetical protein
MKPGGTFSALAQLAEICSRLLDRRKVHKELAAVIERVMKPSHAKSISPVSLRTPMISANDIEPAQQLFATLFETPFAVLFCAHAGYLGA